MSILRTSTRHVIICCKVCIVFLTKQSDLYMLMYFSMLIFLLSFVSQKPEGRQALLEISGTRMGNWRVKVELWFEFCFHMTRRNVLLIENLPESN